MSIRSFALATLLAGMLPASLAVAGGEDLKRVEPRARRSAEILAHIHQPDGDRTWLSTHLSRIRIHKKTGFAYVHNVDHGERGLQFKVLGPVMRKKKNLGLTFEVRF